MKLNKAGSFFRRERTKKSFTRANPILWFKQTSREAKEHAAASALILFVTLILFSPLFSNQSFSMVGAHMYAQYPWAGLLVPSPEIIGAGFPQTDHAETFYANSVFASDAIRSGQLPLWFPYSFAGVPLAELSLSGLLYPPRILVIPFMEPANQHDFLLLAHFLLAGLGMYTLLRCWGCNVFGAIFGGMVWEINGYNAFFLTFEHVTFAAAWVPLALLASTLAMRRRSYWWAIASGAALAMAVLTTSLMHAYVTGLLLVAWYAVMLALEGRKLRTNWREWLRVLSLPVCTGIIAATLSAVSWLPLFEWLPRVYRQGQPIQTQLADTIPPAEFKDALIRPRSSDGPAGKNPDFPGLAYTGVVSLFFAFFGLFSRPRAQVLYAVIAGAFALLFALGSVTLIELLRPTLPFFASLHAYTGFYMYTFVIAVLAGFGATELWRWLGTKKVASRVLLVGWCIAVVVQVCQLVAFTWTINPLHPKTSAWLYPKTPLIETLQRLQGPYRVLPILYHTQGEWVPPVLTGKVAAVFQLRSGSGYESLLPTITSGLWSTIEKGGRFSGGLPAAYRPYFLHDRLPLDLMEKVSVGFLITGPGVVPIDVSGRNPLRDGTLELVYQGRDGSIYKDHRALPRAFIVPRVQPVPDPTAALTMLMDEKFDARGAAILIGDEAGKVSLPAAASENPSVGTTANIINDRLNDVEIETVASRAGILVLNDSWAPGWKAFVDDVEQPVLRTNYAFRGVVVPEGRHRVQFVYRPRLFLIGLALSTGTLVIILLLYARLGLKALYRNRRRSPAMSQKRLVHSQ